MSKPVTSPSKSNQGRINWGKVDPSSLVIEDTPMPSKPPTREGKFHALFDQLKPGQCIRCKPAETSAIANSLGDWLKRHGKADTLTRSSLRQCADGFGRVWLVERTSSPCAPAKSPKTAKPRTQLADPHLWNALGDRSTH